MKKIFALLSLLSCSAFAQPYFYGIDKIRPERFYDAYELGKGDVLIITNYAFSNQAKYINTAANQEIVYLEDYELGNLPSNNVVLFHMNQKGLYLVDKKDIKELSLKQKYLHTVRKNMKRAYEGIQTEITLADKTSLKIDELYLINQLEILSGVKEFNGKKIIDRSKSTGKQQTRDLLLAQFKSFGMEVEFKHYDSGTNVIATQKGQIHDIVAFSAHYDSVTKVATDDNGSGTAALLSIANALKNTKPTYTLQYIFFDEEELGLYGSDAFAQSLKEEEKPVAVFNMDMISYDKNNDGVFHIVDCDKSDAKSLTAALISIIEKDKLALKVNKACTDRSDHASFWNIGVPAIDISENFFGGDMNPCYHQTCDNMSKVNKPYLKNIINMVLNVAYKLD